jgi:hypothetical protein
VNASRYYIPVPALWAGLGVKLPDLIRTWRDPLIRSVCWVIFLGGAGFLFAAPPTVAAVNRASGIPNLAAPLDYVIVSAYSAACLPLVLHWRGGPADHVRRLARRWQIGYTVLVTVIIVLFVAGDAPVERRTDFDTYYATTPWIGQMIALYLLGHMTAAAATTALCRRWALEVRGWLRAGLNLLRPYLDDQVRSRARTAARSAGHGDEEASRIGLAAMIAAAVRARLDGRPVEPAVPDHSAGLMARATLVGVAHALRTSPIVAAARAAVVAAAAPADERTPS